MPTAVAWPTLGRPTRAMLTTLDSPATKSTVTASPAPGTDSVAVSPVRSTSARSCGRARSRTSRPASTRSASATRCSPSRYGPPGSRWTRPPRSSVASSREALLGFTPIRRASALTPAGPSARASSSATARATDPTGRPGVSRKWSAPSWATYETSSSTGRPAACSAPTVAQHLDHRHGRGRAVARQRGRVDLAHGRVAAERADDDVVADRAQARARRSARRRRRRRRSPGPRRSRRSRRRSADRTRSACTPWLISRLHSQSGAPPIHGSPARSASRTPRLRASGWSSGSTRYIGSSSR